MHDDWPDDALYPGLIERDPRALEALIRRYSRELSYFIRLVLDTYGTTQDAEECTNDLFVVAWHEIGSYDPSRGTLHTWLTMRAKFIALDRRRQIQRRQVAVMSLDNGEAGSGREGEGSSIEGAIARATDTSMEGLLEQRERRDELRHALTLLPELDRYLVYMRYFRLASTEEICSKTKLSRHAIDTRLWRARKALRDMLEHLTQEQLHAY
ncbi:MAG TPA: sigma-70 family RNA polymerase sigma factor [Ktedonobacterales bacterium]|nr:sigma-70 family RNA polymerase sigma factor [Ktedonobacterales bacterium]